MNPKIIKILSVFGTAVSLHISAQYSNLLDKMTIEVSENENRPVSFTNKQAAFYYTQSHTNNHPEHAWFTGMNIAKNRIFHGYQLFINDKPVDNKGAKVSVNPYKMLRTQPNGLKEELWMFDYKNGIEVGISGKNENMGIRLLDVNLLKNTDETAFFKSMEGNFIIAVSSVKPSKIEIRNNIVFQNSDSGGFFITAGKSESEALSIIEDLRNNNEKLKKERAQRMEKKLLGKVYISSSDKNLENSLNWLQMTMDQLVTNQQGEGIYAGLPWFNEYWGRDEFISVPGAVLVSGEFETTKNILKSFAEFQDKDPDSKFFGRVPNIVNPKNIDYHTTDGTPRYVIELQNYVKYSGDKDLIKELYPVVKNSIEGSLKNWTDEKGYLLHEDNETWMDARDQDLVSYSPRGNRANDIQDLWYRQLLAGVYFADYLKDPESSKKWKTVAEKVKNNFAKDFTSSKFPFIADRIDSKNIPEFSIRPNQLFAMDLINDEKLKISTLKTVWTELVYPWGVATLDKKNPLFHPFHLTPDYHKDAAYHNGTIWPWLNGIAMQRMIEAEQPEIAYRLFKNMNRIALTKGVTGGLSENLDAFPHKGQTLPKLTGTYLQAWSNAEQLRTWYQYFLGIRPDMTAKQLTLAPRIPDEIKDLDYQFYIGKQLVRSEYKNGKEKMYAYHFSEPLNVQVNIFPYEIKNMEILPDSTLEITDNGKILMLNLKDSAGKIIKNIKADTSSERLKTYKTYFRNLENTEFSKPDELSDHPVIKTIE